MPFNPVLFYLIILGTQKMIIISLGFLKKNLCFYQVARSPGMYCVKMLTIQVIISLEMKQLLMRFRHRTVQQTFILI